MRRVETLPSRCSQTIPNRRQVRVCHLGLLIGGRLLSGRGGKIGGLLGGVSPGARKARAGTARDIPRHSVTILCVFMAKIFHRTSYASTSSWPLTNE
jgi:hypothetical protein